ncbi:MAG: RNA polymerase subunit sigma-70, partial [Planctomycetaceae bacterium]|nr:RNA polymerase subunit sigma-70 [Planctomycetaceae bacterium]
RIEFLHDCLSKLDTADQELLQNTTFKNQTMKEIAKTAHKSIQTLYNRLSILRRELADCVSRRLRSERQV